MNKNCKNCRYQINKKKCSVISRDLLLKCKLHYIYLHVYNTYFEDFIKFYELFFFPIESN